MSVINIIPKGEILCGDHTPPMFLPHWVL